MNARLGRIVWVAVILSICGMLGASHADTPKKPRSRAKAKESPPPVVVEEPASTWPTAELTLGFQVRDSETEGIGDLLIPVWNPGGNGLLFINPRSAITDHSAEEYNVGIGYRQLFPKHHFILGANAYYDYRDTSAGHYDQWGAGLELLSTWVDARVNYYDPEDKQLVVASETETSTRQYTRTSSAWLDPYAENHAVLQDYRVTQTLVTETSTRTFEQYQQPLGGIDWEIGLRLPIQAKNIEARIFGGYYDFDRDFGDDVKGWKARAEVRLNSTLFLDAGIYEDDQLTGSDWFAGARVALPLDFAALSRGRNPFAKTQSRWSGEGRELSARLTEMVMRDPQIRLETSKMMENKQLASDNIARQSSSQQGAFVMLPDVQFVDGDAPFSGDGSAEFPLTTIQAGANTVFGSRNVYAYNASGPYNENVVLQDGTTLWGSGSLIPGMGGKSYGSGIAPIVDGRSMGPSITMANNTTVRGMHVRNTDMGGPPISVPSVPFGDLEISRIGIYANNATDLTILENTLAGNSDGALLAREGDFRLLFTDNLVRDNDWAGLVVLGAGTSGTFDALIRNSSFIDNGDAGLVVQAQNYDLAMTRVHDSLFTGNQAEGAFLGTYDSLLAFTIASGISASGNVGSGVAVNQFNNDVGLANLSDILAHNNQGDGILLTQDNVAASIGVVGMPDGFAELALSLADLAGLGLPDELLPFFQASGPVSLSGNAGSGIFGDVIAGGLALGAFFDITANNNDDAGFDVYVESGGLALGLAGSSQNLSEILELGLDAAGLFGLDLPNITGGGQMQVNNNQAGMYFGVFGLTGAFAGVAGLEAVGNDGLGVGVFVDGGLFGVAALARLQLHDNAWNPADPLDPIGGLILDVEAGSLALGLIADANITGNNGAGIDALIQGDSIAALLTLSTDGLRPLAGFLGEAFLGEPYDLPGQPFGPVTVQNNSNQGIFANVSGDDFALAAFLDTQANGNWDNGFEVSVQSDAGSALAAFLSTDLLYDVVPPLLGGAPIPGAGLGGVQANNNFHGNGIDLNVAGDDMALALFAGVEANNNLFRGIDADLLANQGDAMALFYDVNASGNQFSDGIDMTLFSGEQNTVAGLLNVTANQNAERGINIESVSTLGSSFSLLGGVETWNNGLGGIRLNALAGVDAAAALTAIQTWDNLGNGAEVILTAENDAFFFGGSLAALEMDAIFGFLGALGPAVDLIPDGAIQASGNLGNGLDLFVTSLGDATIGMLDVEANDNAWNGLLVNSAPVGDVYSFLGNVTANDNGVSGIQMNTFSLTGDNLFALAGITTGGNQEDNLSITAGSFNGSTLGILSGITSFNSQNGSGIFANLFAGDEAVLALTSASLVGNNSHGAMTYLEANGDVALFVGNQALGNLDAIVGPVALPDPIADLLVQGTVFSGGNGAAGIRAELESDTGDVTALLSGVTVSANENNGLNLLLTANNGDLFARVQNTLASFNEGNSGVRLSLAGGGGNAEVWFQEVTSLLNEGNGVNVIENYNGAVSIGGQENRFIDNVNNGIRVATSGLGGAPVIDFGGGGMASLGNNWFFGNGNVDFRYNNGGGATAMAENNWWNMDADPVANGRTVGNVDATPWLPAAP